MKEALAPAAMEVGAAEMANSEAFSPETVIDEIVSTAGPAFSILKLRASDVVTLPKRVWLVVAGTKAPSAITMLFPRIWISGVATTAWMVILRVAAMLTPAFLSVAVTLMV